MLNATQGFTYNKFEKPNDWPKIDKTFDYKIENGKLLSGNEHIYLNGPVTYTKVGNPTIKNNIVSGFSNSNYITVAPPTVTSSLDIVIKYKLNTRTSYRSDLLQTTINHGIVIREGSYSSNLVVYFNDGESWSSEASTGVPVVLDTWSYIKLHWSSSTVTFSYSYDNDTWTQGSTVYKSMAPSWGNSLVCFGGTVRENTPLSNGSIDLSETYIKVNDRLWFYGKNYTTKNMVPVPAGLEYNNTTTPSIGWVNTNTDRVKGPVSYTVVGNPTIVDGVLSNTGTGTGLQLPYFSLYSQTSFEYVVKIKRGQSDTGTNGTILTIPMRCIADNTKAISGGIYKGGNNLTVYAGYTSENTMASYQLPSQSAGDIIYVKWEKKNGVCSVSYSLDNSTWTEGTNEGGANNTEIRPNNKFSLGYPGNNLDNFSWPGFEIDLNETYIKINGQPWFGFAPTEFQQFTAAPQGTMIGKDETEMLQVETYQDKGTVDYTVVGSPTIADGVASGFSESDYLTVPFDTTASSWEIILKAKRDTGTNDMYYISSNGIYGLTATEARLWLSSNGTSHNLAGGVHNGPGTMPANTDCLLRFMFTGTQYTYDYSVDNGANWTNIAYVTSTEKLTSSFTTLKIGQRGSSNYMIGTIDLNETYIKVNGQYWFHPYPNSYPKLVGPVSYTVVGSPTIVDGVVSGLQNFVNYIKTPELPSVINSFEFVEKVKISSDIGGTSLNFWYASKTGPGLTNVYNRARVDIQTGPTAGRTRFVYRGMQSNEDTTYLIRAWTSYDIPVGSWIYCKCKMEPNNGKYLYSLSASSDGTNWSLLCSDESETPMSGDYIGSITMVANINGGPQSAYPEAIDLNETYIKVNNTLWFGKEDWTPSTYTDNSIYLLGSHTSNYSSYKELDFTPTISDNSTYDLWIDNQKVAENRSQGTHIDWEQLDLSTGYSITTPSALKAHTIKISPSISTKQITSYQSNAEYTVEDGKLVWVDTNMYIQSDGNSYIDTGISQYSRWTFECQAPDNLDGGLLLAKSSSGPNWFATAQKGQVRYWAVGNNSGQFSSFSKSTKVKVEVTFASSGSAATVNGENISRTEEGGDTNNFGLFASSLGNFKFVATLFGNTKCYALNGELLRDFVPVPQGLVIGSYTVPSNGMFDIVNQQFYANQGTGSFTIGKDS